MDEPGFAPPIEAAFLACHRHPGNVAAHLLTTPVGIVGGLVLADACAPGLGSVTGVAWAAGLALTGLSPFGAWGVGGGAMVLVLTALSAQLPGAPWVGVLLLVAGYLLQSAAHALSGEPTFESVRDQHLPPLLAPVVHTLLLPALVLRAAGEHARVLRILLPRTSVVWGALPAADEALLDRVATWTRAAGGTLEHTFHAWVDGLPGDVRGAILQIASSPAVIDALRHARPGCVVQPVPDMDEIYVSGPDNAVSSDGVFHRAHVDGPFAMLPAVEIYRVLLGVTPNERVTTCFVHAADGAAEPVSVRVPRGGFLGFDFHRELHYIRTDAASAHHEPRVTLKLHYAVAPRGLGAWGWLVGRWTARYDRLARWLFLRTIVPETASERFAASMVLATTRGFDWIIRHVGFANLGWILGLALASAAVGSLTPLVVGTSFVHYALYLGVYALPAGICFERFRRDAVLYKGLALLWLVGGWLAAGPPSQRSIVVAALGFGLSTWAASALGPVRTWFGAELGVVPHKRVERGPYGLIPHPMITGAVVGLIGLYLHTPYREAHPWWVPIHVALYLVHLAQEVMPAGAGRRAVGEA